ncbi:helix-turn-helix domain-containing protein [Candidatus Ornithobacterium hominis]|uniref:helix-turn-helix domain-containing protein n=1 Tax=Candidatus Ornithobacterium hominis TaxID=2497989 RepID=UPI0021AA34E6|nr:helix-turn-helix transcriptional regulator [Candidatus Ornithobacterium hominis]
MREAKRNKNFSQEYMANPLDISQSQYSRLEKGEIDFEVSKLSILIDTLELNPMGVIEFTEK